MIKNLCVYDNGKGVKIEKKNIFTILAVVVVQLHTHNSLTRLAISTKLCEYIDFHMKMCISILIFCKQCSSCKTTTNSLRQYTMIGT